MIRMKFCRYAVVVPLAATLLASSAPASRAQQNVTAPSTQPPLTNLPQFEAASVRPTDPGDHELNGFRSYAGGRIVAKGCRLQYLIMLALQVDHFQIEGLPAWAQFVTGDPFDVQAVPPENSQSANWRPAFTVDPLPDEERQMLLALLIDRFHLKFHTETREGQIYLLERGKGDLKLLPPKDKNAYPWAGGDYRTWYGGKNIPMAKLAERMSSWLERPVVDETGLAGSFDFDYRNNDGNNDADITGFLLTAMKAIGLELKSGKAPIETIVIDHVEKPSPN